MLLGLFYGFFTKPFEKAKQNLVKKYPRLSVYFQDFQIKLTKKFGNIKIDASLTKTSPMLKYPYMKVEID